MRTAPFIRRILAMWCPNCDIIFELAPTCPRCDSGNITSVTRWLDRDRPAAVR
jgi:hypothetical protein